MCIYTSTKSKAKCPVRACRELIFSCPLAFGNKAEQYAQSKYECKVFAARRKNEATPDMSLNWPQLYFSKTTGINNLWAVCRRNFSSCCNLIPLATLPNALESMQPKSQCYLTRAQLLTTRWVGLGSLIAFLGWCPSCKLVNEWGTVWSCIWIPVTADMVSYKLSKQDIQIFIIWLKSHADSYSKNELKSGSFGRELISEIRIAHQW